MKNHDIYEFMERCDNQKSVDNLFSDFGTVIAKRGFHSYIYTGLPAVGDDVKHYVVKNAWPPGWTEQFEGLNYFADDPVSRWSLSQSKPFTWKTAREETKATARTKEIQQEADRYRLCDGIVFPMFDPNSWQSVISLATDDKGGLAKENIGDLYLLSSYCAMTANNLLRRAEQADHRLTDREKEILQWVSRGKTDWEIGTILRMTEGSVTQRLARIRDTLGVKNRPQTVSQAIRLGLINSV
ncbi:two-component transcriptional regulator LuxR family (plasmid) [Allorhizobium ampelinum S4]|uniref:Two-component transcriptional regulator LuxR family n=1 Tax=Allorhizobium ampelinum (strain ATCC BAA-846 / DSM 112012 / S4) TaxID=311402 RepID=B9K3B4_ALLAM|nr:autoinducer binding domain-containing protein [Allorhizobium ampelinum]ACM39362.1 two-component transcriptional regulator LuxR family [Allorhizobium ampelinum S4]